MKDDTLKSTGHVICVSESLHLDALIYLEIKMSFKQYILYTIVIIISSNTLLRLVISSWKYATIY